MPDCCQNLRSIYKRRRRSGSRHGNAGSPCSIPNPACAIYTSQWGSKPARVLWVPKSAHVSSRSNVGLLRSLQYRDCCACSWNRDGAVSLRRMPHSPDVYTRCDECAMFLLSHCQPGYGSKSSCACKLRELPYAAHVPVWRKVCQMRSLQFCDISWGLTWYRPEA